MMSLRCKLGFHKWAVWIFKQAKLMRECNRCKRKERWRDGKWV